MSFIIPFILVFCGVASDYITTQMALFRGFPELNPNASYLKIFVVAEIAFVIGHLALGNYPYKQYYLSLLSSITFIPAIANILFITGLFAGF